MNKRKRQKVLHQLTLIFVQGAGAAQTRVESTSLASGHWRALFWCPVLKGRWGQKLLYRSLQTTVFSRHNSLLQRCLLPVQTGHLGLLLGLGSDTRCAHFPDCSIGFCWDFILQSVPSFDRSLNLLFLNGCCLLPDLFPFGLRTLSAELPPKQPLNEGKHLKLSIWIFR